ncbi:hypothetical protein AnigIFM60653_006780 [Aspergillus niger]|uniref:Uncharacterized protein n=1 Tax=Aspergillus welwitschiae TaxID=1341132 RepID=A0A3F3PNP4_9EURO|nr:hypothetical protein BDQ94DRAFT_96587 [Aspergillus welwitschiae]RDH28570.1 hypothetical protein BDQ94DRAFT_96587 [Aspergillus welwitschiae]GLA06254.1 hypothetical protein AnigIFM60653_006780 [Aspergillus niger]GLA17015.1 hypothetical protein AnigIFM62618_004125 [Aspergillus niger]
MRLVEPWASRYCTTISGERYGDAIWARYHIDGRATGGIYSDLRDNGDGPFELHETSVYDLVMEDARDRELAEGNPEHYSVTLRFYRDSSPNGGRRDIIEGPFRRESSCQANG